MQNMYNHPSFFRYLTDVRFEFDIGDFLTHSILKHEVFVKMLYNSPNVAVKMNDWVKSAIDILRFQIRKNERNLHSKEHNFRAVFGMQRNGLLYLH